jgi:hypothetical protein
MEKTWTALVCTLVLVPSAQSVAQSGAAQRPVVVELFTSEGCSSCPPADAFLTELAQNRPDLLPLAFHITYWNGLGWRDPFALQTATERQRAYAKLLGRDSVFTPELVVEGSESLVGSDRVKVEAAIRQAASDHVTAASIRISRIGDTLTIDVGRGSGAGTVLLVGFDPLHRTPVSRGENGGRTLTESNIVRSIESIGEWSGGALHLQQQLPPGQEYAAIVQASNGQIIGAARLSESPS